MLYILFCCHTESTENTEMGTYVILYKSRIVKIKNNLEEIEKKLGVH